MLNKPPLCDLMEHVDSKYGLVIMVAKRARSVVDHNPDVVSTGRFNAVSMAMREVADGKLHWKQNAAEAEAEAAEAAEAPDAEPALEGPADTPEQDGEKPEESEA
ncbi:MAG: DNA-directed RNA polymerase subunit omega [Firmicutes bacterium]|nr:DNA-directed RNA polymerase subunit omega [Bacillota bacterium]